MSRTEAIALIQAMLPSLDDARVSAVAEIVTSWKAPSVYASLPDFHKARIDAALDRLDHGNGISSEKVFSALAARLKTAGA